MLGSSEDSSLVDWVGHGEIWFGIGSNINDLGLFHPVIVVVDGVLVEALLPLGEWHEEGSVFLVDDVIDLTCCNGSLHLGACVGPSSCVLALTPWVSHLDEFDSVNSGDSKHGVGMTTDEAIESIHATGTEWVVLGVSI